MSRVLGTAFGAATLFVCAFASRKLRREDEWSAWDALPALLLAGVSGYACWSSGGLETQLFTFLVTLGAALYLGAEDPPLSSAIAFGLSALTRPEGLFLFALTGLHLVAMKIARRKLVPTRAELRFVLVFLALVVPHLLWRRSYYGWWLPNTFYIKSSGGAGTWQQGAFYLWRFTAQLHMWVFPLLAAIGFAVKREAGAKRLFGYALLVCGAFCVYVASVGGDFMGLYRFMMPIVPLLVLCGAFGLRLALDPIKIPIARLVAVVALLGAHAWHARTIDKQSLTIGADRGIDTPGYLRWYTADRAAIGKWFGRYRKPDDYAAVGGAGAQVWYSRIPSLDCFGLSDAYIAHEVPATSHRPGHQKYAPDHYILSKKPTIITSHNYRFVNAPYVPPEWEAKLWAERGYRYVSVQVPGMSSPWYAFLLRNDRHMGPEEREP
jgi:hypothetical protein